MSLIGSQIKYGTYVDIIDTSPSLFLCRNSELSQRRNHAISFASLLCCSKLFSRLSLYLSLFIASHRIEEERVSYLVDWSIMKLTDKLNNAVDGSFVGRFFQIKVRYH